MYISHTRQPEKYACELWESSLRHLEYLRDASTDRVAQLAGHWASIPKVVGLIRTVAKYIFRLYTMWI